MYVGIPACTSFSLQLTGDGSTTIVNYYETSQNLSDGFLQQVILATYHLQVWIRFRTKRYLGASSRWVPNGLLGRDVGDTIPGIFRQHLRKGIQELLYLPKHAEDGLLKVLACVSKIYGALRVDGDESFGG